MGRWVRGVVLVCCGLVCAVHTVLAQDTPGETAASAGEEEESKAIAQSSPLYWDLRLQMTLGPSDTAKHVRLFLPVSEDRQTILRRAVAHDPLRYQEKIVGENLQGRWSIAAPSSQSHSITYDLTIKIDGEQSVMPVTAEDVEARKRWLGTSEYIQVGHPEIRQQVAESVPRAVRAEPQVRALFDFVHTAIARDRSDADTDAVTTLTARRGNAVGKARLLVALLRAAKIPARIVGGLTLRDLKRRRHYTYWVEAQVGPEWYELDPSRGHYRRLPNRYLALFRGDLPLIRYAAGIDLAYEFLVMQTTREAASGYFTELQPEGEDVGNAKSMTNPVASMVWVSDADIPPSLVEKFIARASEEQVRLTLLTLAFESRIFRGEHIEELLKVHDRRVREADAVILHTKDDAGLYALMSQGARRGLFRNKVLYVNGDIYPAVARFFGQAIHSMYRPRNLVILPEQLSANNLWDLVSDNFLNGIPMAEVAHKWKMPLWQTEEVGADTFSAWRTFLLKTWVLAARAGVSPQSIDLILVLPLIAFFIVLYRGVLGFETFGTFTPAIICLAFLRTGLFWGVFLFLAILGLGALLRMMLTRVHLFLVARMALLIGLVTCIMVAAAITGIWWGVGPLVNVSVFPMVIMAGVIENFTRTQMEVGWRSALQLSLSTLGVCIISYAIIEGLSLQSLIFVFPELLLVTMAATVAVGMWRGLRLAEIWKYYRVGRQN
jgi:hypothetical protein